MISSSLDSYNLEVQQKRHLILAHKYQINPAGLSLPTDTDALGAFEQAASVECAYFQPAVEHLRLMKAANKLDADTDAIAAHGEAELRRVLDYYNNVLEKQSYLAGKSHRCVPHSMVCTFGHSARVRGGNIVTILRQSLVD
ncbi:hypothetical protein SLS61_002574 [Didymella pomorum]